MRAQLCIEDVNWEEHFAGALVPEEALRSMGHVC
jgi:hypothetical protein